MANKKNLAIAMVALTLIIAACNATLPQTEPATSTPSTQPAVPTLKPTQVQVNIPQTEGDVPRVKVEDAKAALDSGKAIIVDVRTPQAFANEHIAGAIYISLSDFENNIANVPLEKDQWIITYCT